MLIIRLVWKCLEKNINSNIIEVLLLLLIKYYILFLINENLIDEN